MWVVLLIVGAVAGCRQDMHDQPKVEPLEASSFFDDGRSARAEIPGTVARGHLEGDDHFRTGKVAGQFVKLFPNRVDEATLHRGRQRYDIFCSPCHDRTGSGSGMIVQRGYRRPPSFHEQRLREAPVGYIYDTITKGFGAMPSYAPQIPIGDRWAIVAYIRALQFSQNARLDDVEAGQRDSLLQARPTGMEDASNDAPHGSGGAHE